MHELGVTQGILTTVLEKADAAGAGHVRRVDVVLGELSGFTEDAIRLCFEALSWETTAAGAELSFRRSPAQLHCHSCGALFSPTNDTQYCPECRGQKIVIVSGQEVYVESIEAE